MGRRQKAKGKKRPKSWHRSGGRGRGRRLAMQLERWPDLGVDADPELGRPVPFREVRGPGGVARTTEAL